MGIVEKRHIGESPIKESPKKNFSFLIGDGKIKTKHLEDGCVTTPKIKDRVVTPAKVSDDFQKMLVLPVTNSIDSKYKAITQELYNMVSSLQVGGIALSGKFGDRTDIGIHQKALTKALGRLWDELGKITGNDYMNFSLTVEPTFIPTEEVGIVTVTADSSEAISNFDNIKIYLNNELKAESSEVEVYTQAISASTTGENTIKVVGTILGKVITKEVVVTKAEGFFMGSGQVYTDIMVPECAKIIEGSLEGDYDLTVKHNGDYMFIIIPVSHKDEFRRADMNGLGLKVEIPLSAEEHEDFVVYKSLNTYKAGTYNIDIDINS